MYLCHVFNPSIRRSTLPQYTSSVHNAWNHRVIEPTDTNRPINCSSSNRTKLSNHHNMRYTTTTKKDVKTIFIKTFIYCPRWYWVRILLLSQLIKLQSNGRTIHLLLPPLITVTGMLLGTCSGYHDVCGYTGLQLAWPQRLKSINCITIC